jgi:hypothetical protein
MFLFGAVAGDRDNDIFADNDRRRHDVHHVNQPALATPAPSAVMADRNPQGWKWATAEPAVARWGPL